MITKFYYTLGEISVGEDPLWAIKNPQKGLYYMLKEMNDNFVRLDDTDSIKFFEHMWREMYNAHVLEISVEHPRWHDATEDDITDAQKDAAIEKLSIEIWNFYETTKDYYLTMIGLLDANKSNLMKQIEASTRFNDTPQNAAQNQGYSTDDYSTNVTTTKTDGGTLMTRLVEIENNLADYYERWVRQFTQRFSLGV